MNTKNVLSLIILPLVCVLTVSGCKKEPDKPKYREIEGKVINVDKEKQTFLFEFEYNGKMMQREGMVDPNVEVLINGKTASIGDVYPNEQIRVRGMVEGEGENRVFIAKNITVERTEVESFDNAADSKPADTDADADKDVETKAADGEGTTTETP